MDYYNIIKIYKQHILYINLNKRLCLKRAQYY